VLPPAIHCGLGWRNVISTVTAGGRVAAYLAVLEIGCPLSINDVRFTEYAATILGLLLDGSAHAGHVAAYDGGDLVADLVAGTCEPERLQRRAAQVGVDLDLPHVLIAVEYSSGDRQPADAGGFDFPAELAQALGAQMTIARSTTEADMVLCPVRESELAVRDAVEGVAARLQQAGITAAIAMSNVCRSVDEYADEATALRALIRTEGSGGTVVSARDLGLLGYIANDDARRRASRAARELLLPLIEHDLSNDSNLIGTLRAFLEENGRVRDAAKRLAVHENTVRYRLSRIRELSRIDPAQVESLLEANLALQLSDRVPAAVAVSHEVPR
jgi:DNA-binding PucR family transcriptional regulator